jgi:hypothetical protein
MVDTTHPNYDAIVDALFDAEVEEEDLLSLFNVPNAIAEFFKDHDGVDVREDEEVIVVEDIELRGALVSRLLEALQNPDENTRNKKADILIAFARNIVQNPSRASIDQLYGFLEANNLPLLKDGTFLAYKKVAWDYKDLHSRTFDNSIGATVEMPRANVDDNPNVTCSTGLHAAAFEYMSHYGAVGTTDEGADRLIVVKINPAHVVSVPVDYNQQKMRVSQYEVVDEIPNLSENLIKSFMYIDRPEDFFRKAIEGMYSLMVAYAPDLYLARTSEKVEEDNVSKIKVNEQFLIRPAERETFLDDVLISFNIEAQKAKDEIHEVFEDNEAWTILDFVKFAANYIK